ncbi:hypothetical protein CIHG_07362 [Coccidioides immitis H538.4]|uniref:Uncharacterized protein n=2 Tax=Coccidioides immitis TaxID=5501 RepID=A0A0J8RWL3_COCIT|nr:hypothetical protein CIRG_00692 [Coccidioides immitis RMSCC 2394]KMU89555.1 hypothetical protein CIHG_07362 [Coccidioides immitis H538.4]
MAFDSFMQFSPILARRVANEVYRQTSTAPPYLRCSLLNSMQRGSVLSEDEAYVYLLDIFVAGRVSDCRSYEMRYSKSRSRFLADQVAGQGTRKRSATNQI